MIEFTMNRIALLHPTLQSRVRSHVGLIQISHNNT